MPQSAPNSITVLITGFGQFPGVATNISGPLAKAIAQKATETLVRDCPTHFHHHVLPTEWDNAPAQALTLLQTLQPAIVLHFGVSEKAKGIVIETQARNTIRCAPDAKGYQPKAQRLCDNAPSSVPATLSVDRITESLKGTNVTVKTSDDAGGYLCNAVLFTTLTADTHRPTHAGFIHVPTNPAACGLSDDTMLEAGIAIVRSTLDDLLSTMPAPS